MWPMNKPLRWVSVCHLPLQNGGMFLSVLMRFIRRILVQTSSFRRLIALLEVLLGKTPFYYPKDLSLRFQAGLVHRLSGVELTSPAVWVPWILPLKRNFLKIGYRC